MVAKKKSSKKSTKGSEAQEIAELNARCSQPVEPESRRFASLPISKKTLDGLKAAGYLDMTDIQAAAIPLALAGKDVLGAAKTGSGKTLAFLIPTLEKLYRQRWSSIFGVGAVIISPTRELAYQTFEVLRKVGKQHEFSAGLIIGGKDFAVEQGHINNMNILICTPGRLLQHMDETPDFSCSDMQILILDEADRILDMGFEREVNAIVENLPRERQTLLFSATQTKSVKDLARLSLKDPEYVAVHEKDKHSTPEQLLQTVLVCTLPEKMDVLYSFLRTHTQDKMLIFVSSCKQVRFLYETFRRMRPGVPLMALYGKQKQMKRMAIYNDFCKKSAACMFATDIAARGLDFPAVNWVVQFDCPEDTATYIHRVGRTARYKSGGKALLMLLPSEEEAMLKHLEGKKIPVTRIKVNPNKAQSCVEQFKSMCAADPEIKHLAQKSFISYVRSVFLQKDKGVFDVEQLPLEEYALSLGLSKAPKIRFVKKQSKQFGAQDEDSQQQQPQKKKPQKATQGADESEGEEEEDARVAGSSDEGASSDEEELGSGAAVNGDAQADSESEDEFLVRKGAPITADAAEDDADVAEEMARNKKNKERQVSKVQLAKKLLNKGIVKPKKTVFGDEESEGEEGEERRPAAMAVDQDEDEEHEGGIDIEKVKAKLKAQDKVDREAERARVKAMHKEKRRKDRERRKAESQGATAPVAGGFPVVEPHYLGEESADEGESENEGQGGQSAGEESGSEYEEEYARPGSQKRPRGTPRHRSSSDEESGSDGEDSDADAWASKRTKTLEADEALALKLLGV